MFFSPIRVVLTFAPGQSTPAVNVATGDGLLPASNILYTDLLVGPNWTPAALTFGGADTPAGPFNELWIPGNVIAQPAGTLSAGRLIRLSTGNDNFFNQPFGFNFMRVVSGSPGTPVVQTAGAVLTFFGRRIGA